MENIKQSAHTHQTEEKKNRTKKRTRKKEEETKDTVKMLCLKLMKHNVCCISFNDFERLLRIFKEQIALQFDGFNPTISV